MEEISIQLPKMMVKILRGYAQKKEIDFESLICQWLDEKIVENAKVDEGKLP